MSDAQRVLPNEHAHVTAHKHITKHQPMNKRNAAIATSLTIRISINEGMLIMLTMEADTFVKIKFTRWESFISWAEAAAVV
ncbi:MAG: hypothetical protein ACTS6G_00340 [Candidatus Hodgkinia cicadicola]